MLSGGLLDVTPLLGSASQAGELIDTPHSVADLEVFPSAGGGVARLQLRGVERTDEPRADLQPAASTGDGAEPSAAETPPADEPPERDDADGLCWYEGAAAADWGRSRRAGCAGASRDPRAAQRRSAKLAA